MIVINLIAASQNGEESSMPYFKILLRFDLFNSILQRIIK